MKHRISRYSAIFLTIALVGCASAPQHYDFESSGMLESSKDLAWEGVMRFFTVNSIPIKTVEKDSGVVYAEQETQFVKGRGKSFAGNFAECPDPGLLYTPLLDSLGLNVFVVPMQEGSQITVNATYRRIFEDWNGTISARACNPTGVLEESLIAFVERYVSQK